MPDPAPQNAIDVGDMRVTYLPDGEGRIVAGAAFPASSEESWSLHPEWLDSNHRLVVTLGGFLVETGDRKIVVDLGFGDATVEIPDFAVLSGGRFLDSLKQAGVTPADVDTVVYTHMHVDHTGWTARHDGGQFGVTFPNARYLAGAGEWGHWQHPDESGIGPHPEAVLQPLENRLDQLEDGQQVAPGVTVMATPGHTPGHQSVVLSSGSARAIILGDVLTCPVQLAEPEWSVVFDVDPALAKRTREALMAELEGTATAVAGGHFPDAVFGRVLPGEGKRLWSSGSSTKGAVK